MPMWEIKDFPKIHIKIGQPSIRDRYNDGFSDGYDLGRKDEAASRNELDAARLADINAVLVENGADKADIMDDVAERIASLVQLMRKEMNSGG